MLKTDRVYYPALDGLRLVGMSLVVLHHSIGGNHTSLAARVLAFQTGNGLGPTLFFVLSGLLLTGILLQTRESANRYGRFLLRRSVRIFPLYYLYLLLAAVLTLVVLGHPMRNVWLYGLFLQSTMLRAAGQTGSVLPLYHLWTLGAQEQFYLLWPFVVWRCATVRQLRLVCVWGVVLSLLVRVVLAVGSGPGDVLWMTLPCRMGEMVLGGLLAVELLEPSALTGWMRRLALPMWGVYAVWTAFGLFFKGRVGATAGLLLVTVASAGLVLLAAEDGSWLNRVLRLKPVATIGKRYSFAIYMFHPLMLTVFSLPWVRSSALRYPAELLFLAAVVLLSYHGFERRFLRIGSFISAQSRAERERAGVLGGMEIGGRAVGEVG